MVDDGVISSVKSVGVINSVDEVYKLLWFISSVMIRWGYKLSEFIEEDYKLR